MVKTDSNGVLIYGIPKPGGWWGFSAIMEGTDPMLYEGQGKKVEVPAVLWVQAYEMQ